MSASTRPESKILRLGLLLPALLLPVFLCACNDDAPADKPANAPAVEQPANPSPKQEAAAPKSDSTAQAETPATEPEAPADEPVEAATDEPAPPVEEPLGIAPASTESPVEATQEVRSARNEPEDPYAPDRQTPAPDASQLDWADKIMALYNEAQKNFGSGYFHFADTLAQGAERYSQTYELAPRPRNNGSRAAQSALTPLPGLFSADENKILADGLRAMNAAIQTMFMDYARLETYVKDNSIHDDGVLGEELTGRIASTHARFRDQRERWLGLLEKRTREAEEILLHDHPLRRQILVAHSLLDGIDRLARLPREEARNQAPRSREDMTRLLADGERPPFMGTPDMERNYRAFLSRVKNYLNVLDRALAEGWHAVQHEEVQHEGQKCARAYNAFVEAANAS